MKTTSSMNPDSRSIVSIGSQPELCKLLWEIWILLLQTTDFIVLEVFLCVGFLRFL